MKYLVLISTMLLMVSGCATRPELNQAQKERDSLYKEMLVEREDSDTAFGAFDEEALAIENAAAEDIKTSKDASSEEEVDFEDDLAAEIESELF